MIDTEVAIAGAGDELTTPPGVLRGLVAAEVRQEWRVVTTAIVATLIGSVTLAMGPLMVQRAIDDGMDAGDSSALAMAVAGYLVALWVSGVASGVRSTAMAIGSERFIDRLRVSALAGVLRLDFGRFERLRRGDLLARVTADTEALSGAAQWVIPDTVRYVADLAAALIALAILDPILAVLTLIAIPPMAAAGKALRRRSAVVYPRYRDEIGRLIGEVTETVEGADTVLAHGRSGERLHQLRHANRVVTDRYLDGTAMRNRFYASITLTRVSSTAVMLVAASLLAIEGQISVGTAAAGVLTVSTVFGPLAWMTELLDDIFSARAALDRVVAASAIAAPPAGTRALPERGDLTFDGVGFSYVAGRPVLAEVDVTVPAGARVAVVGETGAGKSTLARLAAGLARPTIGVVRFGGVDLAIAEEDDRRKRFLFVLQDSFCFTGSLADNLRLAAPDTSDDELRAAAASVGLADWVESHPDGLERSVGAEGSMLSAGERQLVAILRVVLADPAVVILDEATAILDQDSEAMVGTALDRALGDRTVIVIAHRPETARRSPSRLHVADGHVHPVLDAPTDQMEPHP